MGRFSITGQASTFGEADAGDVFPPHPRLLQRLSHERDDVLRH
jgi:hypothetical protein